MDTKEVTVNFLNWIKIKINTHFSAKNFNFSERQIWWASIGQNIGIEQNGKNQSFERPVFIIKKFNDDQFWSLPISTKIKTNKYNYIFNRGAEQFCLSLSQLRVMDKKRLLRYVGDLSQKDFKEIRTRIKEIIG